MRGKTVAVLLNGLREPLMHFLIGGALVFAFFAWRGEVVDPESRSITVTVDTAEQLAARFEQTMQRTPTPAEMDGIIRDYVREEVYYREAIRLGLDADDEVIRRRLRSKMEYLARAEAEAAKPDDATLQAWLDRNAARYAADARYSFDQIFLGDGDGAEVLRAVNGGADWKDLGKPISLPKSLEAAGNGEIDRILGQEFAAALAEQKQGDWTGPIRSGFGQHLVRIRKVEVPQPPKLAEIRQRVENDWRVATATSREAKAYQALLDGYSITIEKP
jgi:peptidyl-prolyl cis-trans isomerase C